MSASNGAFRGFFPPAPRQTDVIPGQNFFCPASLYETLTKAMGSLAAFGPESALPRIIPFFNLFFAPDGAIPQGAGMSVPSGVSRSSPRLRANQTSFRGLKFKKARTENSGRAFFFSRSAI
ncbi:MAG: hypothetical protein A3J65_00020 [Candidatus Buchananbacteria bacterium RIFCSPHIGHO2_02_FULL_45_11b]|uniref:Uncharacterized protein n=3 Tax=Candidatus Buchananiibacteriota TaxID=1817903 RepID=A0A1G1Y4Y6_9BACT|nr:MAG: hypothetical protein A2663_04145 [Candidatus Buchananbacteria bacterium RIFCSPHIGHO2_01_FULL_46_12]OGY50320.1 MAG: hypothetical protein A3J65_00020 [Candidatus Buchananbacteria bacterium RIFCSPHIGHO2_02_FULL_45_11b]OGY57452.1 MAG: hypothetical protein A3H67_02255 [Candidatus Buchananbacteria bacterium RIFCSPLOWO2_02_FULL_46_11b]